MKQAHESTRNERDPVELLLGRIARRALSGSLLAGAAVMGCTTSHAPTDSDGEGQDVLMQPSSSDPTAGRADGAAAPAIDEPADDSESEPPARRDAAIPVAGDAGAPEPTPARDAFAPKPPYVPPAAGDAGLGIPVDAYDPCARGPGFPVQAAGLMLATPADYVAVRQFSHSNFEGADAGAESWTATTFKVLSESGERCATATGDACEDKVAHHPVVGVRTYCVQACVEYSIVTTRGDQVERWAEPSEIVAALGNIDGPDDALMVAASRGYNIQCGESSLSPAPANVRYVQKTAQGYELIGTKYANTCPVVTRRFRLLVTPSGEVRELDSMDFPSMGLCIGRVPAGLAPRASESGGGDALGAHLAACAHLEAASVHSFRRLAEELRTHGAPDALVARALAAAEDEVRHAEVVGALARAHGARVSEAQVEALPPRSLEEIARENAVEGCVRETYGALVGALQAERAEEPALRAVMEAIARDEARHAALSHAVQRWAMAQLDAAARVRIAEAQRAAIAALREEASAQPDATLCRKAGLPDAATSRLLVAALEAELWQPLCAA